MRTLFDKIKYEELKYEDFESYGISETACSLLYQVLPFISKLVFNQSKLLKKQEPERLGCGKEGMKAIKDHPFFNEVQWSLYLMGKVPAPLLPSTLPCFTFCTDNWVADVEDELSEQEKRNAKQDSL